MPVLSFAISGLQIFLKDYKGKKNFFGEPQGTDPEFFFIYIFGVFPISQKGGDTVFFSKKLEKKSSVKGHHLGWGVRGQVSPHC